MAGVSPSFPGRVSTIAGAFGTLVSCSLRNRATSANFADQMESDIQPSIAVEGVEDRAHGLAIPAWSFMIAFIVGGTSFHIWLHHAVRETYNVHQIGLIFFLMVNLLVNFWEIGLFVCKDQIRDEYEATKDAYRGREAERFSEMFRKRIPVLKLLSFRQWTEVWSSYALFDPGYASRSSFGFNIDFGNGWSTPVFAGLFAFGMTFELMPARILGIIGVIMFWQMFYGTVVYFFQFFNAGRHKGHSLGTLVLFIGTSNGLWFIFPLWGLALSIQMILHDSYSLFF